MHHTFDSGSKLILVRLTNISATARSIAPSVTVLMNLIVTHQTGTLPTEWKKSLIVPRPKSSTATTPNDYRPISLFDYSEQSVGMACSSYYFGPSPYYAPSLKLSMGLQPVKSTVTALLSTVDNWLIMLDEGREIAAFFFFDLRKAFDSVPHKVLMEATTDCMV